MNKTTYLSRRFFLRQGAGALAMATAGVALPSLGAAGVATSSGQARSLTLRNMHTREHLRIAYWADGQVLEDNYIQLSQFLRDHRQNEAMLMDENLFHQLWELKRSLDHDCTFEIVSGYRSPKTNAMLRASSEGVSRNSFHLRGKALDIRVIGLPTAKLRKHALALKAGGVGYYPGSRFVHIDTGPVRNWTS